MRILCTETDTGLADAAAERLQAAGHEVTRCFDPAAGPSVPCVGLDRDACPLDGPGGVDVVLDVRSPGRPRPVAREAGVTCALRRHVPLAMAGPAWPNPFARWVSAAVHGDLDAVEACRRAAERRLVELGDAVSIAACKVLGPEHHPGVDVHTDVGRLGGELQVTIHRPPSDAALDGAVAVHAHGALRAAGADATSISLSCTA
jgi:hypothetical protein